ncbi:transposable element Tc3 transposase [Trichonephila clavipes]|nr:transposable element Tc3 transposase [Trichonephila clavipes]
MEWDDIVFFVFTDESRFCLQHPDGRIRVWRHLGERMLNRCDMHHHTGTALRIMIWGAMLLCSKYSLYAGFYVVLIIITTTVLPGELRSYHISEKQAGFRRSYNTTEQIVR